MEQDAVVAAEQGHEALVVQPEVLRVYLLQDQDQDQDQDQYQDQDRDQDQDQGQDQDQLRLSCDHL
mgnify:CR=1 FL=1